MKHPRYIFEIVLGRVLAVLTLLLLILIAAALALGVLVLITGCSPAGHVDCPPAAEAAPLPTVLSFPDADAHDAGDPCNKTGRPSSSPKRQRHEISHEKGHAR